MNKLLTISLLSIFATGALAADNASNEAAILSIVTFTVTDGVRVQLPKVKLADGTVCQTYVASATESPANANPAGAQTSVVVTMGQICGKAKVIATGILGNPKEEVPGNLERLRTVRVGNLSMQEPDLAPPR